MRERERERERERIKLQPIHGICFEVMLGYMHLYVYSSIVLSSLCILVLRHKSSLFLLFFSSTLCTLNFESLSLSLSLLLE
jgi:hypothetical protein